MARGKRTWFVKLMSSVSATVSWGCADTDSTTGEKHVKDADWARFVQLITDLDGRDVVLRMSPTEARAVAGALVRQADRVDSMNRAHQNGGTYPNEADWARD